MSFLRRHPNLAFCLLLSFLVLLITLPFIDHAFHIDEPLFLRIAQQIKGHPLQPYGFSYLWNFRYEPMNKIAAFSPLFSYFLAAISWKQIFPAERLIHLGIIPFAWIAVLSTYGLARQFDFTPEKSFLAACLLLTSPAFVLSANMAMPDVAAAGFGILATVVALKGWKEHRDGWLILSGLLLGIAFLMRYNAAPLILILGLFGLTYTHGKKAWVPSAIAVIFLFLGMIPSLLSGTGSHTGEVLSVFAKLDGWQNRFWTINTHLTMATFLPFLALLAWWKRSALFKFLVLFLAFDFALYASQKVKWFEFFPDVFIFGMGIATLVVIFLFFWEQIKKSNLFNFGLNREANSLSLKLTFNNTKSLMGNEAFRMALLFFWIISILAIPIIYVHFAAKYLLLIQPPLILILFKILGPRINKHYKYITLLLFIMLGTSWVVAKADFEYANLYREAVEGEISKEVSTLWEGPASPVPMVWFTGHWGWQYYLEKSGALPLSIDRMKDGEPIPGDFVVTPKYASAYDIDKDFMARLGLQKKETMSLSLPIRTMNNLAKAGFYSNHWGPLPFYFSSVTPEEIRIYRMKPGEVTPD